MELFPRDIQEQLETNGASYDIPDEDLIPVVKIYSHAGYVWLLTRLDPANPDMLYGLCDLGEEQPAVGYIPRKWMEEARLDTGDGTLEPLQRDPGFYTEFPLWVFQKAAEQHGTIVEHPDVLFEIAENNTVGV